MPSMSRAAAALISAALAAGTLTACGSSNETVAQVQGASPISKSLIDHWIRIESVLAYDTIPKAPIPAGVLALPPDYSACIAFLATRPYLIESGTPKASKAQLKARCAQHYAEIKQKVINYMIAYRWVGGELARRGLKVSEGEVQKAIKQFEVKNFRGHEFQNYMAYSHLSRTDLHFIIQYTVMGTKLLREGFGRTASSPQVHTRELASFTQRWTARTSCKASYLVPGCREYRGTEKPPL
jgi:hypothetical protein